MKMLKVLGLAIFGAGALILAGFGAYNFKKVFLSNSAVPLIIKWGIIAIVAGLIIVLISLIVERVKDYKMEK